MSRVPAGALPLEGGAFAASVWSSGRAARFHPLHPAKRLTSSPAPVRGKRRKAKKKSSKYVDTARDAVASLQAGSAAVAHSHSSVGTKAATVMAQELWAAPSSLTKKWVIFFSLDATKAANQIVSFPLSAARFISTNMMLQLKAPLL